jgi:predicted ribosome quality control (RQC) complex YloA/Tae2 family protein
VKKQITSLDLFYLVKEMQELVSARVQKVYMIGDVVYLVVYGNNKKQTLVLAPNKMIVTEYEHDYPKQPPMFCMLLRKHLVNKRILSIKQHEFERIVEIEFADRVLIVELFSEGNVVLVDKNIQEIIHPLKVQRWKTREIISRQPYEYPPAGLNTVEVEKEKFLEILKASDKDIVRTLATKFSLGGHYAEEVLFRADIEKGYLASELSAAALGRVYDRLKELFTQEPKPQYYGAKAMIAPFEIKNTELKPKPFKTFSHACDEFFAEVVVKRSEHDRLQRMLDDQQGTLKELAKVVVDSKKEGDLLSQKQEFDNANKAYMKSKKAKKKIKGLKEAIERTKKAIAKKPVVVQAPKKKEVVVKQWFEKFRWFKSSEGFLVVGGKDATTNEIIVKKHAEKGDIVFHAEIVGAPFCVIKSEGKSIPQKTIIEAGQFAAAYSKAWQQGLGTVNVYWVNPDQLSKEKGLPKGAFMVHGKHNYIQNVPLELGFGIGEDKELLHGPLLTIQKMTKRFVKVGPGRIKAGELAKKIKNKLKYEGNVDNIQRFIPSGKGSLK